jgi:hypothetical protein
LRSIFYTEGEKANWPTGLPEASMEEWKYGRLEVFV